VVDDNLKLVRLRTAKPCLSIAALHAATFAVSGKERSMVRNIYIGIYTITYGWKNGRPIVRVRDYTYNSKFIIHYTYNYTVNYTCIIPEVKFIKDCLVHLNHHLDQPLSPSLVGKSSNHLSLLLDDMTMLTFNCSIFRSSKIVKCDSKVINP
jgi:hypothetical protein